MIRSKTNHFIGYILNCCTLINLFIALAMMLSFGCANVKPITLTEINAMNSAGIPAHDIVLAMKDSNTVFHLTASQMAELHQNDGLPDLVIDYMQQSQLDAIRQEYEYCDGYGVYY